MAEFNRFYKCNICGNIVKVVHSGKGTLVCCGEPMQLLEEQNEDIGYEKHVPVIQGNKVKVGSVKHPMIPEHYIEFVEASDGKNSDIIFLKSGTKPEVEFCFKIKEARAYCNVHGLWKK